MLTPDVFVEQKTCCDEGISIFGHEFINEAKHSIVLDELTERRIYEKDSINFRDINISFGHENNASYHSNIENITEFKTLSCLEIWLVDHKIIKIPMSAIPELTRNSSANEIQLLIRKDEKGRKEYLRHEFFPIDVFSLPIPLNIWKYENYEIKVRMRKAVYFKDMIRFYCILW